MERNKYMMESSKMKQKVNSKRLHMIVFGVTVLLLCIFIFRKFIFGDQIYCYLDSNDDTFQSYLPAYQMVVNILKKNAESFMYLGNGIGSNLLTYQTTIFDPFAFVLYIVGYFGGIDLIPPMLVYVQILRILAAAFACKYFLSFFSLSDLAQYVGAFTYAFSAYLLGVIAQHYWVSSCMVFIVLMYALIEHSRKNKKVLIVFSALIAISCIWSIYFGYMFLLACGIYSMIRWIMTEKFSWSGMLKFFLPLLFAVIIGVLLSAVILVPSIILMVETSNRLSVTVGWGERLKNMFQGLTFQQYWSMLLRLFSNQLQGTASAWAGADVPFSTPHLFCSILFPVAFIQYLYFWLKSKQSKQKVVVLFVTLMITFCCLTKIAGTMMNAMVDYQTRFYFVLYPVFAYINAWFVNLIYEKKRINIILILGTVVISTVIVLIGTEWNNYACVISAVDALVCLWIICSVLIIYARNFIKSHMDIKLLYVITGIVLLNLCIDGSISIQENRKLVSKKWYHERGISPEMDAAVTYTNANGDEFWRLERNFLGWGEQQAFTYSEVGDYRGVSFYNSLINRNFVDFMYQFLNISNFTTDRARSYAFNNLGLAMDGVLSDLYGIKYVLSDYMIGDPSWELVEKINSKYLYKNNSLESAGILYINWCSEKQFEKMTVEEQISFPLHSVVLDEKDTIELKKNMLTNDTIEEHEIPLIFESVENDITIHKDIDTGLFSGELEKGLVCTIDSPELLLKEDAQAILQFSIISEEDGNLKVMCDSGFGFSEVYWAQEDISFQANQGEVNYNIRIPLDTKAIKILVYDCNSVGIVSPRIVIREGKSYTNDGVRLHNKAFGGNIKGNVHAKQDSILIIPVFAEKGWRAYIDGKEVPILEADYAFVGLEIKAGEHKVELCYETPGLKMGAVTSFIGIVLLIVYYFVLKNMLSKAEE